MTQLTESAGSCNHKDMKSKKIVVRSIKLEQLNKLRELGYTVSITGTEFPKPKRTPYTPPKINPWVGKIKRAIKYKELKCVHCHGIGDCKCTHSHSSWHEETCNKKTSNRQ